MWLRARWAVCLVASLLATVATGCRVMEETARLPVKAVSAAVPGSRPGQADPAALQTEVQRYADEFANRTVVALDRYAQSVGTSEAQHQALIWKLSISSACVGIASGPNPTVNLIDFLSLSTITRTVLEEDWLKSAQGNTFQAWYEVSRSLETNAWNLAQGILTPEQQMELRQTIQQWWVSQGSTGAGFFTRPQEFTSLIRQNGEQQARGSESVFSIIGLDPTIGLDPAVREVSRARLFAERALFTAQRMPFLLRWQIELLSNQILNERQIAGILTNTTSLAESAERLSRATESASQTAATLPDRITAERKAILDALDLQEGRLRDLSAEVSRTLTSGEKMSSSLNTTLITFDALMKRFGVGEPSSAPPDTNSPPFDILDYARTAEQIASMAQQLDALIKDASGTLDTPALDKRIAELRTLSDKARGDAKSVLNHAFLLMAGLILLSFACALLYRLFTPGITTKKHSHRLAETGL